VSVPVCYLYNLRCLISPPGFAKRSLRWAYKMLLFPVLYYIFNDFCRTDCLNIRQTDLHQVCSYGRTMAVDKRSDSEVDPSRDVAVTAKFVSKIDIRSTH